MSLILREMSDDQWLSPTEAASRLGISTKTLQRWENGGKIEAHRTEGNHRRFKASAIEALLGIEPTDDRKTILYARVSSSTLLVHKTK